MNISVNRFTSFIAILACILISATYRGYGISGTFTVGSGGTYATIEAALAALDTVKGPVVFLIRNGSYTPPTATGFYNLKAVPGMSATNTVTLRPAAGATVTVASQPGKPPNTLFQINAGSYYILDGSNTVGGTSRDWTVRNDSGGVIAIFGNAQFNVVRNMNLLGRQYINTVTPTDLATLGNFAAIVRITSSRNNKIINNYLGDSTGTHAMQFGVRISGDSSRPSVGNRIDSNQVIVNKNGAWGIVVDSACADTKITYNTIYDTQTDISVSFVYTCGGILFHQVWLRHYTARSDDTVAYNQVRLLYTMPTAWGSAPSSGLMTGVAQTPTMGYQYTMTIHHNVMALRTYSILSGVTIAGWYDIQNGTTAFNFDYNTIYTRSANSGSYPSVGTSSVNLASIRDSSTVNLRNNIFDDDLGAANHGLIVGYKGIALNSRRNLLSIPDGPIIPADTLNIIQRTPVQFMDTVTGDLHILSYCQTPYPGESAGVPIPGYVFDIDGDSIYATAPDIGADEGVFAKGGTITLDAPNGGEKFVANRPGTVSFRASRKMTVTVSISIDSGITWLPLKVVNATEVGVNNVTVGMPDIATDQALIMVTENPDPHYLACAAASSKAVFSIAPAFIKVLTPNGGETYRVGKPIAITWTSFGASIVSLYYSTDDGNTLQLINSGISVGVGTYNWTPLLPGTKYRIAIQGGTLADTSDSSFSVESVPLRLLTPNGGEVWYQQAKQTIEWEAPADIQNVHLEYSTDSGLNWTNIIASTPSTPAPGIGQYDWTIPSLPVISTTAMVRVSDATNSQRNDVSDTIFTLTRLSGVHDAEARTIASTLVNIPNPFSERTHIQWEQTIRGSVALRIWDMTGRLVNETDLGTRSTGTQGYDMDRGALLQGSYIYELRCGSTRARGIFTVMP